MVESIYLKKKKKILYLLLAILEWFQKPLCIITANSYFGV